jgi:ligand-binding sensor domain-containing protein/AAA+ ATPase superfamily predicted ATPase
VFNRIPNSPAFPSAATRRALNRASALLLLALCVAAGAGAFYVPASGAAQTESAAVVAGTIQDDRGSPVAEATVTISAEGFAASVATQADGRFEFRNLKPGRYFITARAARFLKGTTSVTVTRPDEVVPPLVIKLNPSSLHVAVLNQNNQPLGGVTLTLYTRDSGVVGPVAARATTDESGDAYFGRLTPGSYELTAVQRGYAEYRTEVFISHGTMTDLPLQLLVAPIIPVNEKATARFGLPNLPSKNVQAVFQDSEGWMWFGTDKGVARFNGADFKSSSADYEQLAGEDVRSIAEDKSGVMWLATSLGVRRVTKDGAHLSADLGGHDARHVMVDSRGDVWISTSGGVFKYDGKDFSSFDQSNGLGSNDARAAAEDKSGRVWVATAQGVVIIEGDKLVAFAQDREPALGDVKSLFVDNSGAVWIASGGGVALFDGGRLSEVTPGQRRGQANSPAQPSAAALDVRAIGQDRSGRMWLAFASGGAMLYDPALGESQKMGFLDRDRVAAIATDREGDSWFGTDNGAVRADLYSFVNYNTSRGLSDNDVRAVAETPGPSGTSRGRLWFVTAAGVWRLMEDDRFSPIERFRANISVRAVAFDRAGSAWFATEQGVFRLSGQTLTQINEGNGLASNNVHWAAGVAGGSAVVFATSKGASVFKDGEVRGLDDLAGYDVRHVFEDADGRLWFATSRGVVIFNPQTARAELVDTHRGLADNDARWITRFNGALLVATRAGVQSFDERKQGAHAFAMLDAAPATTLFVDRDNYLWAGTDDGEVKKFTAFGGHVISALYSGELFALTGNRINSFYEDSDRHVWIATDKGAVRHIPVRVAPATEVSLEAAGRAVARSENGSHSLPYGRQKLTFRFMAVSLSGPVRYLYRLTPQQGRAPWEVLPVQQGAAREVPVFGIDEGAHTFEVVALNRDLYGVSAPPATLALSVAQPFWKRWWFYTLVLALAGAAVGFVMVARRMRDREYILPKELRSYVAIEPNPYIVGNPIRTEKMFYGREDDFRYVRTKLEGVSQGVVIVFCGERRVGKSSILYQVLNGRLGDSFIPVFVDMQEMVIASDAEFFARISRLIVEAVARAEAATAAPAGAVSGAALAHRAAAAVAQAGVSVPPFDGRNPYPVFIDFLDEVLGAVGDRTLLILMDEYELMEAKVDEGKLSPELFTFLAGLMDNKERLALMFTGSRRLEERDKKYWRELLRRSLFRKVGFLSKNDAVRLITEPVAGRVVYGRGVVESIYRLTAGQPFYTQVMCQNVVDYMNEHEQNWVTLADLDKVIADIVDNPLPQMIYTWDVLSDDEKLALSLLAEVLPDGQAFATAFELRASVRVNDYPVNLSENTIRLTLEEMFRRELLEKDAADGFRFKIDLFRLWIRRSHSIWQVVKEVRTL